MIILLDTHAWLWAVAEPEKLGPHARRLIEDGNNTLFLSAVSSWEIAIKYGLGKIKLPEPPGSFVPSRMARDGIQPLVVEHSHALAVAKLPEHHKDPFDRLLISQSIVEKLPVLTADPQLELYDIRIIKADR